MVARIRSYHAANNFFEIQILDMTPSLQSPTLRKRPDSDVKVQR